MDIIDSADLASYLGDLSLADDPRVQQLVDLANGVVSDALGNPADPYTPTARVIAITLEVAARAQRNPDGYSSETIDDYTYRRDSDTRQAGVYLTDSERDELCGIGGTPKVRMGWLA